MLLSIIVPVYNRPDELRELLASLASQQMLDYELIVVEDGSTLSSESEIERYRPILPSVQYVYILNGGPSRARNVGAQIAKGEYLLILDSDVVLPQGYLRAVQKGIYRTKADAFGGPDAASPDFSAMQQAVSYAMTSWLTTGGIRGGSAEGMEQFKPRSFNMGCRRELFLGLGGFAEDMRYGEDIDLSLRLIASGASVYLLREAFVYHKRRVDLSKFFMQVYHSGAARIELETRHPGSTKLVHYLPALFTIISALCLLSIVGIGPLMIYGLLILLDAKFGSGRWDVALRAVPASFVQLWGYGTGFIFAWVDKHWIKA